MAKKKDKEEKVKMRKVSCGACNGKGWQNDRSKVGYGMHCFQCGMTGYEYVEDTGKRCFVATAVYGSDMSPEVILLRQYRDKILLQKSLGKFFVELYYKFSPSIAFWMRNKIFLKRFVKRILDYFVNSFVKKSLEKENR